MANELVALGASVAAIGKVVLAALEESRRVLTRVHERKRTEAALRQSEKLAASTLVAGVAHELNSPLEVILAHGELLAYDAPGDVGTRAEKISRSAQRCARRVKNFLALARQHPPERARVSVGEVVRETAELMTYPLRVVGITLTVDLASGLPLSWADPTGCSRSS